MGRESTEKVGSGEGFSLASWTSFVSSQTDKGEGHLTEHNADTGRAMIWPGKFMEVLYFQTSNVSGQ